MGKSFTLTIKERYELMHYVARLPCTVGLRYAIDDFNKLIDFTEVEIKSKKITIDKSSFELSSNDDSYTITINVCEFPAGVANAIKTFVAMYDVDQMKDDEHVQQCLALFKKVI